MITAASSRYSLSSRPAERDGEASLVGCGSRSLPSRGVAADYGGTGPGARPVHAGLSMRHRGEEDTVNAVDTVDTPGADGSPRRRCLKTAAEVLQALCIVGDTAGVTARELGERLGKSTVTARYLLNTLCQEGFVHRGSRGVYRLRPTPPWDGFWGPVPTSRPSADATAEVQHVPVPR